RKMLAVQVVRAGFRCELDVHTGGSQAKRQLLVFTDAETRVETSDTENIVAPEATRVRISEIKRCLLSGMLVTLLVLVLDEPRDKCALARQVHTPGAAHTRPTQVCRQGSQEVWSCLTVGVG